MTDKPATLNWKNDWDNLEDEAHILTEMKHGFISGTWNKEERCVQGYYWKDMEWNAYRYVRIEELG